MFGEGDDFVLELARATLFVFERALEGGAFPIGGVRARRRRAADGGPILQEVRFGLLAPKYGIIY